MAKKAGTKKKTPAKKSLEQTLWDTADKLHGTVESSEYKHVVPSLIFLKFVSDRFQKRRAALIDNIDNIDTVEDAGEESAEGDDSDNDASANSPATPTTVGSCTWYPNYPKTAWRFLC